MNEKKMHLILMYSFIVMLGIICLSVLFLVLSILGFQYTQVSSLIIFLVLFFVISLTLSVMLENNQSVQWQIFQNKYVLTAIIIVIDFIVISALHFILPGITLPMATIIGFTCFSYFAKILFMRWINHDSKPIARK